MPQKCLQGRLAISRRCTSGDKSAWEADFLPDVTRRENWGGSSRVVQSAEKESPTCAEGATAEVALKVVLHGALQWGTVDKEAVEGQR